MKPYSSLLLLLLLEGVVYLNMSCLSVIKASESVEGIWFTFLEILLRLKGFVSIVILFLEEFVEPSQQQV